MGLSKHNPPTTQVKLLVSPTSGRIPWSLLSWLALGSSTALFIIVLLSGARLIIDPYSPNWLKTAFPTLANTFEASPQTTDEIRQEMRSQGIRLSQPIPWPKADQPQAWFYPILNNDGKTIKELWIYRVQGTQLQQIDQVTIRPIKESFITTPLVGTASQVASVDSEATLSSIRTMPGQSPDSPWLLLEGKRRYGNTIMRYGQILSYQPSSQRLHRLLNWSSPANQPPQWHSNKSQLLIDQTVGLRPSFLLYQLIPSAPPRLQEVSLYRSVYESDTSNSLYDKSIKLAQGGVWSHSLQMMESAKQSLTDNWLPEAQTQLDLIRLHAEQTKAQTEQTWSSQQQHVLTYLIDGQWEKALSALEAKPAIYSSTLKRLELDFDALWRSVTTHLQVHPNDEPTLIWGALLVTARRSPEAGEEWLQKKNRSPTMLERLQAVDGRSTTNATRPPNPLQEGSSQETPSSLLPATDNPGRYQSLIGRARKVGTPGSGWLRPQTLPTLTPEQTWYHIEIQLLRDDSGWGFPPISTTPATFWAESLDLRRQMMLFKGNTSVAGITIHGVKLTGAGIVLLATGPQVDGPLLVTTDHSLRWLATFPWQSAPAIDTAAISAPPLGSENQESALPSTTTSEPDTLIATEISRQLGLSPEQTGQLYPYLNYARVDLVGDSSKEYVISIGSELPPELALIPGKTLIFSNAGDLLYSDIGQQKSLLAVTQKSTEQPLTMVLEHAGRYELLGL